MTDKNKFVDYYEVLGCEKTASSEELKRNYQRLALSFHPDKTDERLSENFLMIQKAWGVLRDLETRKQYDAELACYENSDILLYNTICISDMKHDVFDKVYTYECRCGGTYYVEESELVPPSIIISCNECSFSIQVHILANNS